MFADNQELYNQFSYSFENITVSDLMTVLNNHGIRIGIIILAAAISSNEYSVSKALSLSPGEPINSPLHLFFSGAFL